MSNLSPYEKSVVLLSSLLLDTDLLFGSVFASRKHLFNADAILLVIDFGVMRSSSDLAGSISLDPLQRACGILCLRANLCSEVHNPALKFRMVGEFSQMHLRGKMTRIENATLSTSPDTRGMVSHRLKTISVVQTFPQLFSKSKVKALVCNCSSLPLISIPSFL